MTVDQHDVDRAFTELITAAFVAEPAAPTVPAGTDAVGSAAVHGRVADVSSPPLTSATPPPPLDIVFADHRTWTCKWSADRFEAPLDIDPERAVRKPKARATPNGWVPLFKCVATTGFSSRHALFLPGHVTQDLTDHGLCFARTPRQALEWASMVSTAPDLGVLLVAVRADEMKHDSVRGKVRAKRCYTMASLQAIDRLTHDPLVHVTRPGTSVSMCGVAVRHAWVIPNCPDCLNRS